MAHTMNFHTLFNILYCYHLYEIFKDKEIQVTLFIYLFILKQDSGNLKFWGVSNYECLP